MGAALSLRPLSGPDGRRQMIDHSLHGAVDLLLGQRARRGSTLVMVTHDLSLAARCDDLVRLHSGEVDTNSATRPERAAS